MNLGWPKDIGSVYKLSKDSSTLRLKEVRPPKDKSKSDTRNDKRKQEKGKETEKSHSERCRYIFDSSKLGLVSITGSEWRRMRRDNAIVS